jgi:hypothetical protein
MLPLAPSLILHVRKSMSTVLQEKVKVCAYSGVSKNPVAPTTSTPR